MSLMIYNLQEIHILYIYDRRLKPLPFGRNQQLNKKGQTPKQTHTHTDIATTSSLPLVREMISFQVSHI